jgi:hypothetical protein
LDPKTQTSKAKLGKHECIKLKSFNTSKERIKSTDWEKTFTNQIRD